MNSLTGSRYATIDVRSGYQRLTGDDALSFVRFRHTDSDLYRLARQQSFVKAMKQQVAASWSLTKIPGIVNTITDNVDVQPTWTTGDVSVTEGNSGTTTASAGGPTWRRRACSGSRGP